MAAKRSFKRILADMGKALLITAIVLIGTPLILGLLGILIRSFSF